MRVYLSHAMSDADIVAAKALTRQFDMIGHQVARSLDFRDDPLNLRREIALQNSDLLVVLLTSAYERRGEDHPELALAREYDVPRYFLVAESMLHVPEEVLQGEIKVVNFQRDERGYAQAVVHVLDYFEDPEKYVPHRATSKPSSALELSETLSRHYDLMIVFEPQDRMQAAKLERLLRKNGLISYWPSHGLDEAQAAREWEVVFQHVPTVLVYGSRRATESVAWGEAVRRAVEAEKRVVLMLTDEALMPEWATSLPAVILGDNLLAIESRLVALLRQESA